MPVPTGDGGGVCEGHSGENDEAAVGMWGVTAQSPTAGYKTGLTHTAGRRWDGHARVAVRSGEAARAVGQSGRARTGGEVAR